MDEDGNVVVFHRGSRIWNSQTFDRNNVFSDPHHKPIVENTVVVFTSNSGKVIQEWGSNIFYLPHGLTMDLSGCFWITDVALHQVMKFCGFNSSSPVITLGEALVPGNDETHFCKPTDVAISKNGDFFVSDGYCNSRIIKYDRKGTRLMQWGRNVFHVLELINRHPSPYQFSVPHALALDDDKGLLYVADREAGRVVCFNSNNASFVTQISSDLVGSRLFGVALSSKKDGLIYVINGPTLVPGTEVGAFVLDTSTHQVVERFGFKLKNPHDLAISADGNDVYVSEIGPNKIWKFSKGDPNSNMRSIQKPVTVVKSQTSTLPHGIIDLNLKSPGNSVGETHHIDKKFATFKTSLIFVVLGILVVIILILIAIIAKREISFDFDFMQ